MKVAIVFIFLSLLNMNNVFASCNEVSEVAASKIFALSFDIEVNYLVSSRAFEQNDIGELKFYKYKVSPKASGYPDFEVIMLEEPDVYKQSICIIKDVKMILD